MKEKKLGIDPFFHSREEAGEVFDFGTEGIDPFFHVKKMEECDEPCIQNCEIVALKNENFMPKLSDDYPAENFYVKPLIKILYVGRNGRERSDKEELFCSIVINGKTNKLILRTAEICSICKIITSRFAEAIINCEAKNAEKIIEKQFRHDVQHCGKEYVFFQAGWQSIGERMYYLYDGRQIGNGMKAETGMTLPTYPCDARMILDVFCQVMKLYRDRPVMSTMLAFSLMGVLFRPFKEAGYPPHFALFLNGKTGSMKTTIGKILFTQLCQEEYRDNPRRIDSDSAVSLERGIVESGYDTVTLIDDFSPAKTIIKKNEMQDKLEMIIRMVGDGSSRSRSNVELQDLRGQGVQGMVALTGELTGKGMSSNLRCFYCKMEREKADEDTISWFQENPYLYCTFIAQFADFVGEKYMEITDYIKCNFSKERKNKSSLLRERRLIDSAVTLCLATDILGRFLKTYGMMDEMEVDRIVDAMQEGIANCAIVSEEVSMEESPGIKYVRAIASLMTIGKIRLKSGKILLAEISEFDGFFDDSYYYFCVEIHKKVVQFLRQTNVYFPYDLREILTMLADDNIIKPASNGARKQTFCARISLGSVRHNFLKVKRSVFDDVRERTF